MLIGEAQAVSELWDEVRSRLSRPREDRPGQPVFVIREPPSDGGTGLRAATPDDLELLVPACAAAHEQEIGVDPLRRDPEGFRWRTRTQIEEGRSWLWAEDGVIRFKAEASAWTPSAVQLQQVWVDPAARRQGYGARGLRDLCRLLLERVPAVCLFVRAENHPAIRLYETIGMEHVARLPLRAALGDGDGLSRAPRACRVERRRARVVRRPGGGSHRRRASTRPVLSASSSRAKTSVSVSRRSFGERRKPSRWLSKGRDVARIVVPELNEIHFGSFDGGLLSAYREWAGAEAPGLPAPGGGESRAQAAARYASGLRIVLAQPGAERARRSGTRWPSATSSMPPRGSFPRR